MVHVYGTLQCLRLGELGRNGVLHRGQCVMTDQEEWWQGEDVCCVFIPIFCFSLAADVSCEFCEEIASPHRQLTVSSFMQAVDTWYDIVGKQWRFDVVLHHWRAKGPLVIIQRKETRMKQKEFRCRLVGMVIFSALEWCEWSRMRKDCIFLVQVAQNLMDDTPLALVLSCLQKNLVCVSGFGPSTICCSLDRGFSCDQIPGTVIDEFWSKSVRSSGLMFC